MVVPVKDLDSTTATANTATGLVQRFFEPDSGITEPPVDLGPVGAFTKDDPLLTWRYYACREDHFVDLSAAYPNYCYLRAWAFAQLSVATQQAVRLALTTRGPADVWLNGQHLHRQSQLDRHRPHSISIPAALQPGTNELLVRFETAGVRGIQYGMALQVEGLADADAEVGLPTEIEADLLEKRLSLEKIAAAATIDRYVYGFMGGDRLDRNQPIVVSFPDDLQAEGQLILRLQSLQGDIFQERTTSCKPGAVVELAKKFPLRNGPHHLALWPPLDDYYTRRLCFERKELFYVTRTAYAEKPGPGADGWTVAALEDAAHRRNESLYCEIAKLALGQWEQLDRKILERRIRGLQLGGDSSLPDLLGLLGSLLRFRQKNQALHGLGLPLESSVTNYPFWMAENAAGSEWDAIDCSSESGQILYHTCEILAGQLLPDRLFARTGKKGRWHRQRGVEQASAWLRQHGRYGFQDWDSPASVETILGALSHLVDLSSSETVRDLASVVMDKIFFSLAVNSFKGAYGSSRGRTDTASVLSARLEPTSGIARLMWGLGNFNENLIGSVSLACCRKYELPDVIRQIATGPVDAFWSRERHVAPAGASAPAPGAAGQWAWEAVKTTYKTNDFMLSCAQDYRAGQRGTGEHIWQATLGPDAIAFVNHPTSLSEDDTRRPNLWAGNGVLPRAAQWGDVLVAIYQLPAGDWLGFTHAYFPAAAFDEYALSANWAFARQGRGYLALMAACGLEFVTTGQTAFRELRSHGAENIWLCHMGQALLDGSFEDFQHKILALELSHAGPSVRLTTLRGDSLAFGWEGPLLVNGQEQPLTPARHIENSYCIADLPATQMDIVYQEQGVRLKFE